jgi:hypothetical protein
MSRRRKKKQADKALQDELRRLHFESGGSPQEWRGLSAAHKNKRDKRQNRRTRRTQAVEEQS